MTHWYCCVLSKPLAGPAVKLLGSKETMEMVNGLPLVALFVKPPLILSKSLKEESRASAISQTRRPPPFQVWPPDEKIPNGAMVPETVTPPGALPLPVSVAPALTVTKPLPALARYPASKVPEAINVSL